MAKFALITDTHFGIKNDNSYFHQYQEQCFHEYFLPELKKRNIKEIIHCGDFFDRRKSINFNTLQVVRRLLEYLNDYKIHIILGNHDVYYKNTNQINSPKLILNQYENITIYENPTEVGKFLFLPWITQDNYDISMKAIQETDREIVMGHLELNGYIMFKGAICDHGLDPNIFHKFKLVLSGHFHSPHKINNVCYLGCPWDLIQTDSSEEKGFYIFDDETLELEFIPIKKKIFKKLIYDDSKAKKIKDILLDEKTFSELRDTFVKVYIKAQKKPIFFDRFTKQLSEASCANITYVEDFGEITLPNGVIENLQSDSTLEILKKSLDDYSALIRPEQKEPLEKLITTLFLEASKDA
jgi:DNA repair exonuclease SbcCD nuclease subunit